MTIQIPKWFDDPEIPRPCPCGHKPYGPMLLCELEEGGNILVHLSCAESLGLMEDDDD